MSKILFILITTSVIFTGCIDNNEKSAEAEAPAGNPPAESETTENDNSCGNDYIYSKTKNSITWQDVYDKQKKYDLEKPEDILDEFGDRRFNPQYSRYETGYNLHNKTTQRNLLPSHSSRYSRLTCRSPRRTSSS